MFKVKTKRKQHELQTCIGDTVHISTEKKILEIVWTDKRETAITESMIPLGS